MHGAVALTASTSSIAPNLLHRIGVEVLLLQDRESTKDGDLGANVKEGQRKSGPQKRAQTPLSMNPDLSAGYPFLSSLYGT